MATSIRLSSDAGRRLDFPVSQTGRSRAFYLGEIAGRGLEDPEDCYLAAEVLQRVRAGSENVHTAAAVSRALALDD